MCIIVQAYTFTALGTKYFDCKTSGSIGVGSL